MKRKEYNKIMKKRKIRTFSVIILVIIIVIGILVLYKSKKLEEIQPLKYLKSINIEDNIELKTARDSYENLNNKIDIKEIDYDFGSDLEYGNNPKYLVLHHTASYSISPESINEMHKEKGWAGIGYHFYIRKDGTIYRGRPEEAIGAHAIGRNRDSLGICLEGNFENEYLTGPQLESLEKLSLELILKYNISEIIGHRDVYSTLCPGENFPIENIKNEIGEKIVNIVRSE